MVTKSGTALAPLFDATTGATPPGLLLKSPDAEKVPLTVQGAAGQTASLQEWQDDSEAIQTRIDKSGYFMTRKTSEPDSGDLEDGELALWLDPNTTTGPLLMIKAKIGSTAYSGSVKLS